MITRTPSHPADVRGDHAGRSFAPALAATFLVCAILFQAAPARAFDTVAWRDPDVARKLTPVETLSVYAQRPEVPRGEATELALIATLADGSLRDATTSEVAWRVEPPAAGVVTGRRFVAATVATPVRIHARFGAVSAHTDFRIVERAATPPSMAVVLIEPLVDGALLIFLLLGRRRRVTGLELRPGPRPHAPWETEKYDRNESIPLRPVAQLANGTERPLDPDELEWDVSPASAGEIARGRFLAARRTGRVRIRCWRPVWHFLRWKIQDACLELEVGGHRLVPRHVNPERTQGSVR